MNNENDDDDDDLQAFQLIVLARYLLGVPQFWLSSMEDQKREMQELPGKGVCRLTELCKHVHVL